MVSKIISVKPAAPTSKPPQGKPVTKPPVVVSPAKPTPATPVVPPAAATWGKPGKPTPAAQVQAVIKPAVKPVAPAASAGWHGKVDLTPIDVRPKLELMDNPMLRDIERKAKDQPGIMRAALGSSKTPEDAFNKLFAAWGRNPEMDKRAINNLKEKNFFAIKNDKKDQIEPEPAPDPLLTFISTPEAPNVVADTDYSESAVPTFVPIPTWNSTDFPGSYVGASMNLLAVPYIIIAELAYATGNAAHDILNDGPDTLRNFGDSITNSGTLLALGSLAVDPSLFPVVEFVTLAISSPIEFISGLLRAGDWIVDTVEGTSPALGCESQIADALLDIAESLIPSDTLLEDRSISVVRAAIDQAIEHACNTDVRP